MSSLKIKKLQKNAPPLTNSIQMLRKDTIAVENEVARNMYERSELDYLIYNAPLEYADLILNGDPENYIRTVTV